MSCRQARLPAQTPPMECLQLMVGPPLTPVSAALRPSRSEIATGDDTARQSTVKWAECLTCSAECGANKTMQPSKSGSEPHASPFKNRPASGGIGGDAVLDSLSLEPLALLRLFP